MKNRKNSRLWQAYILYEEMRKQRIIHGNRAGAIKAGKSNLDLDLESTWEDYYGKHELLFKKEMINYGKDLGSVWDWTTSVKGIGASLAAQLLAQIDDISKAPTISALWRYCGYGVVDGKAERNKKGELGTYNRKLKSICWNIRSQFIRHQTPLYSDIYYAEKKRLREKYPANIIIDGKNKYNDGHIHNMAIRKAMKIFLSHLWVVWRSQEGLEISKPYSHDILGHSQYVDVPRFQDGEIAGYYFRSEVESQVK